MQTLLFWNDQSQSYFICGLTSASFALHHCTFFLYVFRMANLKQKFGGLAAQLEGDASSFQVSAGSTMALVSSSSEEKLYLQPVTHPKPSRSVPTW